MPNSSEPCPWVEDLAEARQLTAGLSASLPEKIEIAALGVRSKAPFQLLTVREALIWRTEELAPLVAQYGQRVKPVRLEVRDETAAKAAVQLAVELVLIRPVDDKRAVLLGDEHVGMQIPVQCSARAIDRDGRPVDRDRDPRRQRRNQVARVIRDDLDHIVAGRERKSTLRCAGRSARR